MMRSLTVGLVLIAGSGHAQDCPDFYRFVDFGLEAQQGIFTRGGPIFRVEGFDGVPLQDAATSCRDVYPVAADGHGNPIPVVERLSYDTAALDLPVDQLDLAWSRDGAADAVEREQAHRNAVARGRIVRDAVSLCMVEGPLTSCQIASPLGPERPVIVSCDGSRCSTAAVAIHPRIALSAEWMREQSDEMPGADSVLRLGAVLATLATLTTALDR